MEDDFILVEFNGQKMWISREDYNSYRRDFVLYGSAALLIKQEGENTIAMHVDLGEVKIDE